MTELSRDLQVMADLIPQGVTVLDIGCGTGELLGWLTKHKNVKGRGLELCRDDVNKALAKGLSIVQGNIDEDLPFYADGAYDYVICSKTLQATSYPHKVLEQLVRVGKKVIVSVPNFGYAPHRLHLGIKGRMPMSKDLSYAWYETPNIHFCTLADFVELCESQNLTIESRMARYAGGKVKPFSGYGTLANIFAVEGFFLLSK